jgi:hypothetical protein
MLSLVSFLCSTVSTRCWTNRVLDLSQQWTTRRTVAIEIEPFKRSGVGEIFASATPRETVTQTLSGDWAKTDDRQCGRRITCGKSPLAASFVFWCCDDFGIWLETRNRP